MVKVAFLQRLLPLYRLGFYKALSNQLAQFELTIYCPKAKDLATNIETISPEKFNKINTNKKFFWVDSKILYYNKSNILWQSGILLPILRKEFEIIVISNKMTHLFYWLIILTCKLNNIRIVFWSHGLQGNETGFKYWLKKNYLNLADINLVYSQYNKNLMLKAGIQDSKIRIVSNSLDLEILESCFTKIQGLNRVHLKLEIFNNHYPVLVFIGRLVSSKRVDILLRAISQLRVVNIYANLIVIGEGDEKGFLLKLVNELSLDDCVHFTGEIYEEMEIAKYLHISDLMVSPGNVGLNCIHSLSYGVPVITHNDFRHQGPEVEAIQENETGLFFEKDNFEDLTDKIKYWLANKNKEECSNKARKRIQLYYSPEFQAKHVVEGLISVTKKTV
jgi:glycosyltransferase involved in cell wall biosynthesis